MILISCVRSLIPIASFVGLPTVPPGPQLREPVRYLPSLVFDVAPHVLGLQLCT
jgi:hypothetical protein